MKHVAVGAGLACLVIAVYGQVYRFDFVNFDDDVYLLQNERVADGLTWDNVRWAFTTPYHSNWHPVTWLSYFFDVELFGLRPGPLHLVNAAFHLVNVVLLYAVLIVMTRRALPSAMVAALFAVHPLHVESVAWVSERKDVLSMFFFLLALLAYAYYARTPRLRTFAAIVVAYALGLMAKPMLVTLPVLLLVLDRWPLERMTRANAAKLVLEKTPLFALAAVSSFITYVVQRQSGAMRDTHLVTFADRLRNAVLSYVLYLGDLLIPTRLAVFYPARYDAIAALLVILAAAVLIALTVLAWRCRSERPYALAGWVWFLVALLPVIGLVQVGAQARADRYMYIPAIGLYVAFAWALTAGMHRTPLRGRVGTIGFAGALTLLLLIASAQVAHWRNSEALFRHAIAVTHENHLAHNNLGVALRQSDIDAAESHFLQALAIKPDYRDARINLGSIYLETGRSEKAVQEYLRALDLAPNEPPVYSNLAVALQSLGRHAEALAALRAAAKLAPEDETIRAQLVSLERGKPD